MSLRGRKFFDVLQHQWINSSRFSLPCPPYHTPEHWDRIYKGMDSNEVHEWGGFDLQSGLLQFRYENVLHHGDGAKVQPQEESEEGLHTSTFAECMDIRQLTTPEEAVERYEEQQTNNSNESILVLGCGNSKLGEQILMNSFVGPVLQVDISSKAIQLMTDRYQKYLEEAPVKRMEFIVDDAKGLTSLSPESVGGGVLDKGLIDVLHCSAGVISMEGDNNFRRGDIRKIVDSVHRALQPSRPFVFFSRSEHEYILKRTLGSVHWNKEIRKKWKGVQVLKLVDFDVMMYRFIKADATRDSKVTKKSKATKNSKVTKKKRKQ